MPAWIRALPLPLVTAYLWPHLTHPEPTLPKLPVTNATEDRSNALAFLQPALHHYQPTYLCDHLTHSTPTFTCTNMTCRACYTSPDLQVTKNHLLDAFTNTNPRSTFTNINTPVRQIELHCIRAPSKRGRYWEIRPQCPRDFPNTQEISREN